MYLDIRDMIVPLALDELQNRIVSSFGPSFRFAFSSSFRFAFSSSFRFAFSSSFRFAFG